MESRTSAGIVGGVHPVVLHRALDIVFDNKFLGEILDVIDGCEGASTEC